MPQFGNTTREGVGVSPQSDGRAWVTLYTLTEDGTISDLFGYFSETASPGTMSVKGLIYADSAGEPGSLLAQSGSVSLVTGSGAGYRQFTLTSPLVAVAGSYWLGVVANNFNWDIANETAAGQSRRKEGVTFASPPGTFGTADASSTSEVYVVYAQYTAGAPAGPTHFNLRRRQMRPAPFRPGIAR